jgi:hypothetical protein
MFSTATPKEPGFIEKKNYRGTIVVFSPYVPAFLGILQELSKEFGV